VTALPGDPLPIALEKLLDADGHLTAGLATQLAGRPAFVLASLGRTVSCLAEDGQVRWRASASGPVYALALLEGDRVAAGDDAGHVTLFNQAGQRLWQHALASRVTSLHAWRGGLLAGGWDERLTFLDVESDRDRVRWQVDLGGPLNGIAVLPDLAAAATLDGRVRAFDPAGAEVWTLDAGAPLAGLGTLETGFLVGVQDGRLLALGADGGLRWERVLGEGSPVWSAIERTDPPDAAIAFGTGGASPGVGLLSARGETLWQVAVPSPVGALVTLDLDGDGAAEILAGLAGGQVLAFDAQGRQRGSVHAGLHVWDLVPVQRPGGPAVLILADLLAWRLVERFGSGGGPLLKPPKMVSISEDSPAPSLGGTAAPPGAQGMATLAFLGDVSPSRTMEAQLMRYGPAYPWGGLGTLLSGAELAVANMESTLSTRGKPMNKVYLLRAHPRWAQMVVEGGIDVVTLANNHALDFGDAGLDETLSTLGALNVAVVGAGRSQVEAHRPALFTLNGVRVAILGYLASRWNGSVDVPATDRLAWADPAAVQAGVRSVRSQADVVVVLLHNGAEYAGKPSSTQMQVAHAAVDAGADLVVGHHPHVTQTVERYHDGLIVYSLGDAVFDILTAPAMQGHLLRVQVTKSGLVRAELWPFWIDDAIRPRLLDDGQGKPRVQVIYP